MTRPFLFEENEFYHVYNRGVDKRNVFSREGDAMRFMKLLLACNTQKSLKVGNLNHKKTFAEIKAEQGDALVDIGAYCLMPNHFHLLIREKGKGGISRFMQKTMTAYTMYFNRRSGRTGTLFEGTFKARHVSSDEYLQYLFAYIHLNPVKLFEPTWKETGIRDREGAKKYLEKYSFSSYLDFKGKERDARHILGHDNLPDHFPAARNFESYVKDWLDFREAGS